MIEQIALDSDLVAAQEDLWNKQCEIIDYLNKKQAPVSQIAIMCPSEDCCGCLTEKIVGLPECNECGKKYKFVEI